MRELETPFGVIDIAGATSIMGIGADVGRLLRKREVAATLAMLKPSSPRTPQYISHVSGMSVTATRGVIEGLVEAGVIAQKAGGYVIGNGLGPSTSQLWCLELKVEHWARALHQALRYRVLAHATGVVMPQPWARNANKRRERFTATGVGLLAVDMGMRDASWLARPLLRRPASSRLYWDCLGRILLRVGDAAPDVASSRP